MHWGVATGDGWYDIIYRLSLTLARIIRADNLDPKIHCFGQIKEKFGVLRVYLGGPGHEKLQEAVREAERQSESVCEMCGGEGILRRGEWLATLCDGCEDIARERRVQVQRRIEARRVELARRDSGVGDVEAQHSRWIP